MQFNEQIFSALGEPKRLRIVELLVSNGNMSATEISKEFTVTSAAISQHLKVLRDAEVLIMEKQAQKRMYQINPEALEEVEEWLQKMKKTWNARFDRLDTLLKNNT